MRKTIVLTLLSCFSWLSYAQTPAEVKGIVQDATTGEPLIGVNILVEGTQAGSVTGLDGDFTISAPPKSTIRVSYIGYKVQMIQLKGESFLTIRLEPDTKLIDEVVVVGYTVQKKRDVLGAISKVESAEIGKIPVATSQQALQGRIAGVNVAAQTGAPGAPVSVRIRGVNSISLSNDPLYIVDGIPVEGALNNISPNEIESMTVLKDASSAAIYGSRATNGVVLITTKNGKSGDSKISYNMQLGFQEHGKLTKMATTEQYISMYNEAASADNATSVVKRALIEGSWVKDFPNVNHLEEIFRTAPFQSHELSVSGGNETTQFLISGIHFIQDGIINTTNFTRTNLRSNISSQLKKWLKTGLNISGGISNNRLVSSSGDGFAGEGGSVVRYALFRNPAIPVYSNTGEFIDLPSEYYGNSVYNSFFGDGYNPVGLTENTDRTKKIKTLMASGNVLISLPADLTLKTTAGIDYNNTLFREYNKTWGSANRINGTNGLSVSSVENLNWSINSTLNHSITLGEVHNLTTMAGAEAIKNSGYGMYGSESEFLNTDPGFLYLGLGSSKTRVTQSVWESTLVSFFANTSYNFNQKYYLSGILRHDGSSRFSKGNQWGTFYSVSGGWNVETEEFMKEIPAIYKLKLRAGYGSIGNQNIPLYSYTDRYGYNFYYTFGGQSYNGYAQTQLGNDKLKWETSNQFNVGADVELLKGELGLTLDYYYKITNDMLLPASLPPSIGNAAPFQINSDGNILNTGIDVEIFYRKNFRDGGFNISLNGGYLKNKVLKLDNPYFAGRVDTGVFATRTEQGYPIGSFFLYEMAGIFQNDLDVLTSAYQGNNIKPGDVKYVDQNEDNIIDARDRTFLGSAIPKITTGLTLSGNYKNFDLSMFFQGAFGQKIFSQVNYDIEGFYRGFNVTERYYREHWTGEGSSNTQPRASWAAKSNNVKASSRFLEDGSYLRLKNLQLGYSLPGTKKYGIDNLRVYLSGTNLLTFTGYSGLDPEMTVSTNSAGEGDLANGIDWGTYPVAMTFTFGINLTF
ncbi:MAG: SusC/RagA family TonB-linked outer membrane protein [Paludibacter sp. 47-17]|nr:MAG: SusC/RagA family TonB-linked outer membrane protein [Paludibacter sp. 47-17]